MRKVALFGALGVLMACTALVQAQAPRTLCDVSDPDNKCPGDNCVCIPDAFSMTFDDTQTSLKEYTEFTAGMAVNITVFTDTKTPGVQGWSYGVAHTMDDLDITDATLDGTDAKALLDAASFNATSKDNVQLCLTEKCDKADPAQRQDGGGFISAVVLSFTNPVELPNNVKSSIAKAAYTMKKDVGTAGTKIFITDTLAKKNSPPAAVNVTVNGKSRLWTTATDGVVKKTGGGPTPEVCTGGIDEDEDGKIDCADEDCAEDPACKTPTPEVCTGGIDEDLDGKIDCADEDCAADPACQQACFDGYALYFGPAQTDQTVAVEGNNYVVTGRNKLQALAFQLGVKVTGAASPFNWEFKGDMGADADRVVELIITDANGDSQTPQTPNKATSTIKDVLAVEKGSAISAFTGDFFAVDLAPALNGPGFTVGYLADLNPPQGGGNKIPATATTGTPCPVNELLKVSLGTGEGSKFSRGDADGNGKINISDAVLIIQNIVGNLPKRFQCDDILDANDDGALNVTDAIPVLNYVFQRNPLGPPLAAPFKTCATDPTADSLSCAAGVTTNCQ